MADIEERASRWADEYIAGQDDSETYKDALIAAYLAGAGQAQADYATHYESQRRR